MHMRSLLALVPFLVLAACAPKRIPGTDIEDTRETRAILQTLERFRASVEAEDAEAIAGMVSPEFRDDGGTLETEDDYNASNIREKLQAQFERVKNIRLSMDVKKVDFDEKEERASVTYYWTLRYEMPDLASRPQTDSELKQIVFVRAGDNWQILSGI